MKHDTKRAEFERAVYQNWAERFAQSLEALQKPGTEVLPEEKFAGSNAIHIWHIGNHAFARLDPALAPLARDALDAQATPVTLGGAHLSPLLDQLRVRKVEDSLLSYLYPPDLRPVHVEAPLAIRRLTLTDAEALSDLQAACHPDEVEEGEVSVEDEIGFGCFHGTQLVAVATGYRLTGFMDIGVLTRPEFRRQGLGKATVTTLSRWCIDHEIIAQYRCRVDNVGSRNIAEGLNFNLVFTQQSIYLEPDNA